MACVFAPPELGGAFFLSAGESVDNDMGLLYTKSIKWDESVV